MIFVLTALVGGLGAAARFALDTALSRRWQESWLRLMVINVSGSALLGLLAGLAAQRVVAADAVFVVGSGFLGGYTTFSAASLATVRLLEQRRWVTVLASSLGMLLSAITAAAIGFLVGRAL